LNYRLNVGPVCQSKYFKSDGGGKLTLSHSGVIIQDSS